MKIDPAQPGIEGFWYFVALRQAVYWRKTQGESKPWTTDPIMAKFHFPNVFRELDPGTEYFHRERQKLADSQIVWASVIYRLVNRRRTFIEFGGLPQPAEALKWRVYLLQRVERGSAIFTRRHLTPSLRTYLEAVDYLSRDTGDLYKLLYGAPDLEAVFATLRGIPGVGPFFAWQVCCDLLEAKAIPFTEDEWCYMGPGPVNATRMLTGRTPNQKMAFNLCKALVAGQLIGLPPNFRFPPHISRFTLKNTEHALCEYARFVIAHWRR